MNFIKSVETEDVHVEFAAWVQKAESRWWTLFVVVTAPGIDVEWESTRIAIRVLDQIGSATITLLDVNLINPHNPVAVDLAAIRDRYPTMVARKLKTRRKIGNLETRGLYLYPPSYPLCGPDPVVHSVLQLLDRSGTAAPSVVTFKDGSQIHAVPVGIRLNTPDGARIDWHDVVTSQERSVAADQVVSIL